MTLSIAWVRKIKDYQELVIATDSRLRGGYTWDCCPKIIILPRSDSVICFAGRTEYAYPLMLQMRLAIEMYPKSRNRAMDIHKMKGHTLNIFNSMRDLISDLPKGMIELEDPETFFLLGGYSWKRKSFEVWFLHYDSRIKKFTFRPTRPWRGVDDLRKIAFAGFPPEIVEEAKARLIELLRQRNRLSIGGFDMEPFEVLRDMIRENVSPYVGGSPQMVKVYQHMNCVPFAIFWPNREAKTKTLIGRPLLIYESTPCPILDPDTLKVHHLFHLNKEEALFDDEFDSNTDTVS